ncbi:MAG: zinc ribbon domain-containing protein [Polyangiales bacterium]
MSGSSDRDSGGGIECPVCRAALPADATFCLMCGTRQTLRPPPPQAQVRVNLGREATMLGLAGQTAASPPRDAAETPARTPPADPKRLASQHRTMMGFTGSEPTPKPPPSKSRTLTGVALAPGEPARVAAEPPRGAGRTMPGIPQPSSATPTLRPPAAAPAPARRREPAPLIGSPGPIAPPLNRRSARPAPRPDSGEDLYVPGLSRPRRSRATVYLGALLAVLAIGGLTAGFLLRSRGSVPTLAATVSSAEGERLTLSVSAPDAAGATLRVNSTRVRLDAAGRGSIEVTPTQVGEVRLPATLERDGSSEPRVIRYFIAWRVVPRFNELGAAPPRLLLEFHVPADAALEVSSHPIRVVNGVGIASIEASAPLAVSDLEGARRYTFPVRVTRAGVVTTGEYALRVRRTPLRVDEPGRLFATDAALVRVRGTAPRATRVLVGGVGARVEGDRFTADVALQNGPNPLQVVAFAPGGVPASQRIEVYRGVTPEQYLAASPGEHAASLLAQPRDGARVRVRGRVLRAIEAGPEGPTFQLLVVDRACPGSQCVAWVDPPHGAALRESQEVDVTGELRGARAYIAGDGTRRSAPVIQALFVR